MRLPDGVRSRAVLMGTSRAADPGLAELPAVRSDLAELAEVLVDGGLRCSVLADRTVRVFGDELELAASQAEELLFAYYSGHGLLDGRGRLFLATPDTRLDRVRWTALPFRDVRDVLLDAPAHQRVLVLDCAFAPEVLAALGDPRSVLSEQLDIPGVPTLVAARASGLLTRRLVDVLRAEGTADRLSVVYRGLLGAGRPKPWTLRN
ncbi:caspase family protein [Umezawaea sp. NPDC059074]|uniref:caspase family protein n=1 Tax=Umezawaea sp. NPDC059074 TaxID=3346716 RepID=UPI003694041B